VHGSLLILLHVSRCSLVRLLPRCLRLLRRLHLSQLVEGKQALCGSRRIALACA
jgi:hypothetical protein